MDVSRTALRDRLAVFDGRSMTVLGEIEARCGAEQGYLDDVIALSGDGDAMVSSGASWLLKAYLDRGGTLSRDQLEVLTAELPAIIEWSAQLHVCQSVRYLAVNLEQAEAIADWLAPLLAHKRPFLRAWSADALCRLARLYAEFEGRAEAALAAAGQDPAASVRARARNLR